MARGSEHFNASGGTMDWTAFVSGLVGAGFGSTLVGVLLGIWLEHRLKIERDELAEKRHLRRKQREASAAIAEILTEWTRSAYIEESSNENRWRLQTTYWKNILWLDKDLLDLLLPTLANAPGAVTTHELIVQARKVLLGLSEPDIKASQLNTWAPEGK
jgi:hypothetical protein